MSLKETDKVFVLVKSLSSKEKRLISKEFSRTTARQSIHYKNLFQALQEMKFYNEKKLAAKLSKKDFPEHFSVIKYQFFKWLLQKLQLIQAGEKLEARIMGLLHTFDILFERKIYKDARKKLEQAKSWIDESQKFEFIPFWYKRQINLELMQSRGKGEAAQARISELEKVFLQGLEDTRQWGHFAGLSHQLVLSQRKGALEGGIPGLDLNELFSVDPDTVPARTRLRQLQALALVEVSVSNWEKAALHFREMLVIYRDHPLLVAGQEENYFITLQNHCSICLMTQREEEAFSSLGELKEYFGRSQSHKQFGSQAYRAFLYYFNTWFAACLRFSKIPEGLSEMGNFREFSQGFSKEFNLNVGLALHTAYFNLALLLFRDGQSEAASIWNLKILYDAAVSPEIKLFRQALMLQTLICTDLTDFQRASEYSQKTFNRYPDLAAGKNLESLLALYLKEKIQSPLEMSPQAKERLLEVQKAHIVGDTWLHLFDLTSWLERQK